MGRRCARPRAHIGTVRERLSASRRSGTRSRALQYSLEGCFGPATSCYPSRARVWASWMCCWRWWCRQSKRRFSRSVGPPWIQCRMWCAWQSLGGRLQPGAWQCPSRMTSAFHCAGGDRRGCAADVEDLGAAGSDDAADVAVAGEQLDHGLGQATVVVALGPGAGDEVSGGRGGLVAVDDRAHVGSHTMAFATVTAVEVAAADVHERIEPPLRRPPRIVRSQIAGHLHVEGGFDELGTVGVAVGLQVEHAAQCPRHVTGRAVRAPLHPPLRRRRRRGRRSRTAPPDRDLGVWSPGRSRPARSRPRRSPPPVRACRRPRSRSRAAPRSPHRRTPPRPRASPRACGPTPRAHARHPATDDTRAATPTPH